VSVYLITVLVDSLLSTGDAGWVGELVCEQAMGVCGLLMQDSKKSSFCECTWLFVFLLMSTALDVWRVGGWYAQGRWVGG
jgi:hypothetical protein